MGTLRIISLTFLVSSIILFEADIALSDSKSTNDLELLREAGCRANGKLLARGVCINDDRDFHNAPQQAIIPISNQGIFVSFWDITPLEVNENANLLTVDLKVTYVWRDDRIKTNSSFLNIFSLSFPSFPGITFAWGSSIQWQDMIWYPWAIKMEHAFEQTLRYTPATVLHISSKDLTSRTTVDVDPNATFILALFQYNVRSTCEYDFTSFPMDDHNCQLLLTNEFIRDLKISLLSLQGSNYESNIIKYYEKDGFNITIRYENNDAPRNSSEISYVGLNFKMSRVLFPYISQYYVPCIAIVCVSQGSFIIPPSSIPGRLGLVATLFLAITNILIDSNVCSHQQFK